MPTFNAFKSERYFERLDGIRAISILLVLTIHSHVTQLYGLHGGTGVTIFFVISGFLITTLLLREEEENGRIRLGAFYVRRIYRLLPLYYIALGLTTLGVLLGLAGDTGDFGARLVYLLTYMNEFAPPGTFAHGWSLAVEEKFYLIWPVLAFVLPALIKRRWILGCALLLVTSILGLVAPVTYVGMYAPILAGCIVAMVMNNPRGFRVASWMARPGPGFAAIAAVFLAIAFAPEGLYSHTQVVVGLAVALAFPVLVIGPKRMTGWLQTPLLKRIGTRAYGIYLFHPLVGSVVDAVLPREKEMPIAAIHLVLSFVLSFMVAEVLNRVVEEPMKAVGRRMSAQKPSTATAPALPSDSSLPR